MDLRMTSLARSSSNRKLQTYSLVKEVVTLRTIMSIVQLKKNTGRGSQAT
jgi:hypothetical protein